MRGRHAVMALVVLAGISPAASQAHPSHQADQPSVLVAQTSPAHQDMVIVTEIRAPDPQAGMKSTHRVRIDFERRTITEDYTTGTTDFFGVSLPSIRNNFRVSNTQFGTNQVRFRVTGETASGVGVVPNINYRFDVQLNRSGQSTITGCHDGYPAYEIRYRHVMLYWFKHKPINVLNLFGTCDVAVNFSSGPNEA